MPQRDPIKVYDARWEVGEFSDDEIRRLFEATFAYGRRLGVDTLTLARDARLGAPHVLEIGIEAAVGMGLRVFLSPHPISTPQSYYTTLAVTRQHPRTMGLTVTASHNPSQYIGIKFVVPTVQAIGLDCGPDGGLSAIREIYHADARPEPAPGGCLQLIDLQHEYIAFSMQQARVAPGDLAGMSVVFDAFHGAAGPEIHAALTRAGVRVHPLRLIPNGAFPTGSPNPTSQGKMASAVALAAPQKGTLVIGVDGDGDRVVFGDHRGILSAGFAAVPLIRGAGIQPGGPPAPVLYDPKVNPLALASWGRLGATPVLFRNGHSQIKDCMRRIGAVAGAEESGHYYHRVALGDTVAWCENSILTILLFLEALKSRPSLMDELWALQNSIATTGEFNYQFADDSTRDRALAAVIAFLTSRGASAVTATPEGIDLEGTVLSSGVSPDSGSGYTLRPGWFSGYIRIATNEKAVVRSYFSAETAAVLSTLEREVRRILADDFRGRIID